MKECGAEFVHPGGVSTAACWLAFGHKGAHQAAGVADDWVPPRHFTVEWEQFPGDQK